MDYHASPDDFGRSLSDEELAARTRYDRRIDALLSDPAALAEWVSRLNTRRLARFGDEIAGPAGVGMVGRGSEGAS